MNLLDAFKIGGLPGAAANAGASLGKKAAQNSAEPLFSSSANKGIFNIGFTDKLMITLVLGTVFVVATSRALK